VCVCVCVCVTFSIWNVPPKKHRSSFRAQSFKCNFARSLKKASVFHIGKNWKHRKKFQHSGKITFITLCPATAAPVFFVVTFQLKNVIQTDTHTHTHTHNINKTHNTHTHTHTHTDTDTDTIHNTHTIAPCWSASRSVRRARTGTRLPWLNRKWLSAAAELS